MRGKTYSHCWNYPQSSAKGGDCSQVSLQQNDTKLIPYFTYLKDGILTDNESEPQELVLSGDSFEVIDSILYHVEKGKTLRVIPLSLSEGSFSMKHMVVNL